MFEIVGRDEELRSVHASIEGVREGLSAVVLEGDAGIGKSTVWLASVEHARARGFCVLSSRPAEAERNLAHVGLGDLFDDVLDDVLPALKPPRRRALEVALLVEEATDPVEMGALGNATRDALQLLAVHQPLLVAIDDFQWFDASSGQALAFALRRLDGEPVLLLLARRPAERAQPSGLERALGAEKVRRLPIGPLTVGALHRFLRDRLDRRSLGRRSSASTSGLAVIPSSRWSWPECSTRMSTRLSRCRYRRRWRRPCARGSRGCRSRLGKRSRSLRRWERLPSRSSNARVLRQRCSTRHSWPR
jgi:hypothetical protein